MEKEKLLISSCFLGNLVKYNGSHNALDEGILKVLEEKYELYPVCPEVDGGLPTPRTPCEISSKAPLKVINKDGIDKTLQFVKGASIALKVCQENSIKTALLKANSPSCSNEKINDGTFTKTRVDGMGVTAQLLKDYRITIYNENEIGKLI
jgi:uncharacterized protein YbbK (DUF523 family)